MKLSNLFCALAASCCISVASASAIDYPYEGSFNGWDSPMYVFNKWQGGNSGGYGGWRIPALTTTSHGTIIAAADKRLATSGNTDMPQEVYFGIKVSSDGGNTWSNVNFIRPQFDTAGDSSLNYKTYITDPAIVSNTDTGTTFIIGYQNKQSISANANPGEWAMYMWQSDDGGLTWSEPRKLSDEIALGTGYTHMLQGPGNGMYYNGVIYIPLQQWAQNVATSAYIYSEDNGKTWKRSELIIPNTANVSGGGVTGINGEFTPITSESTVFHHKGYIYLAAKDESSRNDVLNRVVFRTKDHGLHWERVYENFLPDTLSPCETSTFALTDDVYLVGYSINYAGDENWKRRKTFLTTNTGRTIKLYDSGDNQEVYGYTSISADQDNLYVLVEGAIDSTGKRPDAAAIAMYRWDISAKEYANINAQLKDRAEDQLYMQDVLKQNQSFISGSYGTDSDYGFEALFVKDNLKLAAFHKQTNDNSDDVYRTVAYDQRDTSLLLGYDGIVFRDSTWLKDHFYAGYQYSKVRYANSSEDELDSILVGYSLDLTSDYVDYTLDVNGMFSNHDFSRNRNEGLSKTADFSSKSFAIKNELSKTFEIAPNKVILKPYVGLENINFSHDKFTESYANGLNEFTIMDNDAWSHKIYLGAKANGNIPLGEGFSFFYDADVKIATQLADEDDWIDSFRVIDADFKFARPLEESDSVIAEGILKAGLQLGDNTQVSVLGKINNEDDNLAMASIKFLF